MNGYDFRTVIATVAPNYAIDKDNDGQIIIYTNMREVGEDEYVEWEDEDNG